MKIVHSRKDRKSGAEKHERDREEWEVSRQKRQRDATDVVEISSFTWIVFQVVQSSAIHKDWQLIYL